MADLRAMRAKGRGARASARNVRCRREVIDKSTRLVKQIERIPQRALKKKNVVALIRHEFGRSSTIGGGPKRKGQRRYVPSAAMYAAAAGEPSIVEEMVMDMPARINRTLPRTNKSSSTAGKKKKDVYTGVIKPPSSSKAAKAMTAPLYGGIGTR